MKVAVIGAGVVGLATTAALLERGIDVVCLEGRAPFSERSAGRSRIFRLAHADPELVELAARARRRYADWEKASGQQLIEPVGTVITGPDTAIRAAAMSAAGADHRLVDPDSDLLRLPTTAIDGPSLIDPAGGVLRVDRIAAHLLDRCGPAIRDEHVHGLTETAEGIEVATGASRQTYDAAVICAGAGTPPLAAQVGLYPPITLVHHARIAFRLRPTAKTGLQCWITSSPAGYGSYQHSNTAGEWAVGLNLPDDEVDWPVGAAAATALFRRRTVDYVERELTDVAGEPIGELYCTSAGLGDGVSFRRSERTLVVSGDNLFKHAPVIGDQLAQAAVDGSLPGRVVPVQEPIA